MHFTKQVYNSINNNKHNLAMFIDFKKAFDTVDHNILLNKLYHYGIRGTTLMWFKNYLVRSQFTSLAGGDVSDILSLCFGIPQGTV